MRAYRRIVSIIILVGILGATQLFANTSINVLLKYSSGTIVEKIDVKNLSLYIPVLIVG